MGAGAAGASEQRLLVRRRFEVFEMHMVIYALVEASTRDDALATGKTVFDRLGGADPHAGAVFDYYVCFDEEDMTVAGKARWGELPTAAPVDSDDGQDLLERGWEATKEEFERNPERVKEALDEFSDEEIMRDEDVQQNDRNTCPECDGRVTTNTHETICDNCGPVIDEQRIDHGPEWRAYDDEDERERTGAPLTAARHDRGLSTEIGRGTDAKGNELSGKKRRRLARMRREQTRGRWRSKAERNLAHGLGEVRRLASALELSDSVRDQACQLFRSAQNEDLLRGRSIEAIAAASVYGACRCNGLSRLLDDVSEMARIAESRVGNAYKTLNEELGLPVEPVSPSMFVPRLASDLECPDVIRQRARTLAEQAEDLGVTTGVHPAGFAAACLYTAAREDGRWLMQTEAADVANISTTTIRNHRDVLQQMDDEQWVNSNTAEKQEPPIKSSVE